MWELQHMNAQVDSIEDQNDVFLDFEYEGYKLTPEEAERIGKELIKESAIADSER